MTFYWATLCLVFTLVAVFDSTEGSGPDNQGKEFVLGFMENSDAQSKIVLYITTLSEESVQVNVTTPLYDPTWRSTVYVTRGVIKEVTLNLAVRHKSDGVTNFGVDVNATEEVAVYGLNTAKYSADAFLAYPVDVMGLEYRAVTWSKDGALLVCATEDGTSVAVRPSRTIVYKWESKSTTFTENLNKYQCLYVKSSSTDFTGSSVVTTKPVSVFGGSRRATVGTAGTSTDHLVEQLLPVSSWGVQFAVVSTPIRKIGDIIRVVGSQDGTDITLYSGGFGGTINDGGYKDLDIATNDNRFLVCSKPCAVYLFSKSYSKTLDTSKGGDPFMATILPIPQWSDSFFMTTVEVPGSTFEHELTIVVRTADKVGIIVDENPLPSSQVWFRYPTNGIIDLSTTAMLVSAGTHDVYHKDPTVTYFAMLSGLTKYYSYGVTAGSRVVPINAPCSKTTTVPGDIVDNDCDGNIDEETRDGIDNDGDGEIDEDLATIPRVDGGWSEWSDWSDCECCHTDCVGRASSQRRTCSNPPPSGPFAAACVGISIKYKCCLAKQVLILLDVSGSLEDNMSEVSGFIHKFYSITSTDAFFKHDKNRKVTMAIFNEGLLGQDWEVNYLIYDTAAELRGAAATQVTSVIAAINARDATGRTNLGQTLQDAKNTYSLNSDWRVVLVSDFINMRPMPAISQVMVQYANAGIKVIPVIVDKGERDEVTFVEVQDAAIDKKGIDLKSSKLDEADISAIYN